MNTSSLQISMRKTIDRQHNEIAEMEPLLMELGKLMEKMEVEITELKANSVPIDKLEKIVNLYIDWDYMAVIGDLEDLIKDIKK